MPSVTSPLSRIRRAFTHLFDSRRLARTFALGAALTVPLAACTSLTLTRLNSAQKKPNNVWVFFTVEQNEEPVAGLQAEDFQIYEDGDLVSTYESKQVIQNPEVAAVMYTMLLLDVSGSVSESGSAGRRRGGVEPSGLADAAAGGVGRGAGVAGRWERRRGRSCQQQRRADQESTHQARQGHHD